MSHCARCDFEGDLTQHAIDAAHPLCYVCNRRSLTVHERQTCAVCVARTRADLADIESLYRRLSPFLVESRFPANSGAEKTSGSQEHPIPGGDALVMLAGGGAGYDNSSRNGNREHVIDEDRSDPQSVPGLLATYEDDWRHQLEHPPARPTPSLEQDVAASVEYLNSQLDRMAQAHSEFDAFAEDMHKLRTKLESEVGLSDRPVYGADCFDCGNRLVRRYRHPGDGLQPPTNEPGLEDHYSCKRCDRIYTQAEYMLAVRSHQADQAVGVWRPLAVAAWLVGRPFRTLQTWLRDPELPVTSACLVPTRKVVVWMPDVTEHDRRSGRRQRKEAS